MLVSGQQYYWSAEMYDEGEQPTEWTPQSNIDNYEIQEDSEGNRYLSVTAPDNERSFLEYSEPTDNAEDWNIYTQWQPTDDQAIYGRGQQTDDIDAVSALRGDYIEDDLRISYFDDGEFDTIEETSESTGTIFNSRINIENDPADIRYRVWDIGDEEPDTWNLEGEYGGVTGEGTAGTFHWIGEEFRIYELGVGQEGEEAPDQPTENDISLRTPEQDEEFVEGETIQFEYVVSAAESGTARLQLNDETEIEEELEEGTNVIENELTLEPDSYDWFVEFETDEETTESETRQFNVEEELEIEFDLQNPEEDENFGGTQEEVEFVYELETNLAGDAELALNGQVIDSSRISSGTTQIEVTEEELEPDEYQWSVEFDTGQQEEESQTQDFEILDALFEIDITDTNSPIEPGETLEVTADIQNTGDVQDTQEVSLIFDGQDTGDSTEITLEDGETTTEIFSTADTDLDQDIYIAEVISEEDSDSEEVQISEDFDGQTICGEEHALTPESNDGSRFNEIIIDGEITVCDDGATIQANNNIEVTESGSVVGTGEDGDGTEDDGEEGAEEIILHAEEVVMDGIIENDGGAGGDADGGQEDGGDGADAGDVGLYSESEELVVGGEVSVQGGDAGEGQGRGGDDGNGGDGGTIELGYSQIDEEEATYSIDGGTSPEGTDGAEGEIIRITPEFVINEFESDDPIPQGQLHEVEVEIENVGDFVGPADVEFYFDEILRDVEETEILGTGETTTVQLTYDSVEEDPGDYFQSAEIENVGDADDEIVQEPISVETEEIEIADLSTNSPVTDEDNDILEVETIIENTGEIEGSQEIEFFFDEELQETKQSEELSSGELQTLSFELDISDEDDGEYEVEVASEDDEDQTTVVKGENSYFEASIIDVNDPVEIGETLEVEAEIENVGGETDEQVISFIFEGNEEESTVIELEEGESEIEIFEYDTSDDENGEYEVEVSSEDDIDIEHVFLGESANFDVEILNLEEQVSQGETIEFDAEIENTGDFEDTQDIQFFFEGVFEEAEEVTLDGGEITTETFTRETDDLSDGLYDLSVSSDDTIASEEIQVGEYEPAEGDTEYEYLALTEIFDEEGNLIQENTNQDDGYLDYTESQIDDKTVLKRGETYEITLESEPNDDAPDERPDEGGPSDGEEEWNHYFSLWADWEQNIEFNGEVQVGECNDATADNGCTATAEFTVPEDAELGETRIRAFVLGDEDDGDYINDPTSDDYDGQAIDYTAEVVEPQLEVTDIEAPEIVGTEEEILPNATIENTGSAEGTQTIEYIFDSEDGEVVDTQEITVGPGETQEANFEYTVEAEEGHFEQEVRSEDDALQKEISVEQANYEVTLTSNSPIEDSEEHLELEAEIENTGVVSEPQDIEFYFDDEDAEEEPEEVEEDVEVEPDETKIVEFVKDVSDREDGEYIARVDSADDFDTTNVVIGTDPFFEVEILETNSPVDMNEDLEADIEVENIGGEEDTQDIEIIFDEELVETEEDVELESEESEIIGVEIDTEEFEPEEYDLEASSEDSQDTKQVEILGYTPAVGDTEFEYTSLVQIEGIDDDSSIDNPSGDDDGYEEFIEDEIGQKAVVQRGETYEITMASEQNDDEVYDHYFNIFVDWNQNIEFDQDPQQLDSCETEEGDGCQITAEFEVPEDAELGETRLRSFLTFGDYQEDPTEDGYFGEAEDYTIEVADSQFEIIDSDLPETAESGDIIEPEVVIENTGSDEDTQSIEYLFEDEVEDSETISLDGGESTTVTFEYELDDDIEDGFYDQEVRTNEDSVEQELEITEIDALLEVEIIEPQEDITTAVNRTFDLEAEITCQEDDCGETTALAQYNETGDEPGTTIESGSGEPFHTIEENERTCEDNLEEGETCIIEWEVSAEEEDSVYDINVEANSENSEAEESESRTIKTEFILILETGFEEVDFGSGEPSGEDDLTVLEGEENNNDVYTVSLDEDSNEPDDGLWMSSTPLENIDEEEPTDEDELNTIIPAEHTLFGSNVRSDECESFEETDTTRSSETFQQILDSFEPGEEVEKCFFQEIPNGKLAGEYQGSLTLKVNATQ